MNNNLSAQGGPARGWKITSIIIILIAIGVTGWFLVSKQFQNSTDLTQKNTEVKNKDKQEVVKNEQGQNKEEGQNKNKEQEKVTENDLKNNQDNNQQDIEELKVKDIDTSNWKTYRNEELGFEVKLPGDPKKWNIKVKHVDKEHSKFGSDEHYIVSFNYPLDQKILHSEDQPEMGYFTDMDIWYIEVVSAGDYKDNVCEIKQIPKCRQGSILGKNDKYMFISGFVSITGAGYLCSECCDDLKKDDKCQQQEFCDVFNALDFSSKNFLRAINFKIK